MTTRLLYKFMINSIDVTSYVLENTKIVTEKNSENGTTADIKLSNTVIAVLQPAGGQYVEISRGVASSTEQYRFRGRVKRITESEGVISIACKSNMNELKYKRFTKSYDKDIDEFQGELSAIAKDIIEDGGFIASVVDSGKGISNVTATKFSSDHNTRLNRALLIAKTLNWAIFEDFNNNWIRLEPKGYTKYANTLTVGGNVYNLPEWFEDIESMRNLITVEGATEVDTRQVSFVGDGATKEFAFDFTPENTECTVNGILQIRGIEGATVTYDYTVDASQKKFIFVTAPGNGLTGAMKYTVRLPRPVTGRSQASIDKYHIVQEDSFTFKDIVTRSDAEKRLQQLLELLQYGLVSATLHTDEYNIYPGMEINVVDPNYTNRNGTYIVQSVLINYPEPFDVIKVGTEEFDVNELFSSIDERLRLLEDGNNPLEKILSHMMFMDVELPLEVVEFEVQRRKPADTFIFGHTTLGRFRSSLNMEPDCSNNGNHATWFGSDIGGLQYNGKLTKGLLASYNFTGNANDLSGNGYNGVVTGATLTTDKNGSLDSAYVFDGDDKIESASFPTITASFTVSAWIKPTTFVDWESIVGKMKWNTNDSGWAVYLNSAGNINVDIGNGTQDRWANIAPVSLNTWTHIAVVYNGTQIITYVNNVAYTHSTAIASLTACTDVFGIGRFADYNYFIGSIDAVNVYNRALTAIDVGLLYNSASLLENPFAFGPRLSCGTLNGTDNYLEVADSNSLDFATGSSFSYGGWINTNVTQVNETSYVISKYPGTNPDWELTYTNSTKRFTGRVRDNSANQIIAYSPSNLSLGWHHIMVVLDNDINTLTVWTDGVAGTPINAAAIADDFVNGSVLRIGRRSNSTTAFFTGMIDEIMVFNIALTQANIQDIIANRFFKNHATFANCKLWLAMDNPRLGNRFTQWAPTTHRVYT